MLIDLAEQLDAGSLRSLRAASFIGLGAAAVTATAIMTTSPEEPELQADESKAELEPEEMPEAPVQDMGESSLDELF